MVYHVPVYQVRVVALILNALKNTTSTTISYRLVESALVTALNATDHRTIIMGYHVPVYRDRVVAPIFSVLNDTSTIPSTIC